MAYSSSNDPVQRLWHEHMGHLGVQNLKRLQSMSTGLDLTHIPHEDCTCEACLLGHMKDVPHRESLAKNARPYEVIFSDVEGQCQLPVMTALDSLLLSWMPARKRVRST